MYSEIIKVNNPQVFFQHELDGIEWRQGHRNFWAFKDENGRFADKRLFIPYDLNDKNAWGDKIFSIQLAVEERYSQSIIDSCRKEHKRYGTKQYEWHLVTYPCVINTELGKIVYQSTDHYNEHIYIYENLICICNHSTWVKVLNMNGEVLWDKGSSYGSSYQHLMNTNDYVLLVTNHDYKKNTDQVTVFGKKTGTIQLVYNN